MCSSFVCNSGNFSAFVGCSAALSRPTVGYYFFRATWNSVCLANFSNLEQPNSISFILYLSYTMAMEKLSSKRGSLAV